MSRRRGRLLQTLIKPELCKVCGAPATRYFAEDFADIGRTVFLGHYCDEHSPKDGAS